MTVEIESAARNTSGPQIIESKIVGYRVMHGAPEEGLGLNFCLF